MKKEIGVATTTEQMKDRHVSFKNKGKNHLIPAAAGLFSLNATSGLLATASASAPAFFLALRPNFLCVCCMK